MASFDRTILNRVTNLCLTLKNVWKGLHTHGHHEAWQNILVFIRAFLSRQESRNSFLDTIKPSYRRGRSSTSVALPVQRLGFSACKKVSLRRKTPWRGNDMDWGHAAAGSLETWKDPMTPIRNLEIKVKSHSREHIIRTSVAKTLLPAYFVKWMDRSFTFDRVSLRQHRLHYSFICPIPFRTFYQCQTFSNGLLGVLDMKPKMTSWPTEPPLEFLKMPIFQYWCSAGDWQRTMTSPWRTVSVSRYDSTFLIPTSWAHAMWATVKYCNHNKHALSWCMVSIFMSIPESWFPNSPFTSNTFQFAYCMQWLSIHSTPLEMRWSNPPSTSHGGWEMIVTKTGL